MTIKLFVKKPRSVAEHYPVKATIKITATGKAITSLTPLDTATVAQLAPKAPDFKTWRMPASGNLLYICKDEESAKALFNCIIVANDEYKQIVCFHGYYNAIEIKRFVGENKE